MARPTRPAPPARRPPSRVSTEALDCFAIAAPGLEPIVAAELTELGIAGRAEPGGVSFSGSMAALLRANLWSRVASRVVVRAGRFNARTFAELERHARRIEWERFVPPGAAVDFRVTSKKSRLYHTSAIAERLVGAIGHRLGAPAAWSGAAPAASDDEGGEEHSESPPSAAQLFVVRVVRDVVTVSADSSGALLHRRGYRQAVAKAPLRETLAAALLLSADWRGNVPLVDPMCGSGTIAIEGALIARRIAPGLRREFAFARWPTADHASWTSELERAAERSLAASPVPIVASDRDDGAVAATRANAERAGVAGDVSADVRAVSAMEAPAAPTGLVAVNPPYGMRIGEASAVRDLYAALGQTLRRRCPGWSLAIVSADPKLDRQLGMPLEERVRTSNGGIPVRLLVGRV